MMTIATNPNAIKVLTNKGVPVPANQTAAIYRSPQPEREPPTGNGKNEANAAAKDTSHPNVIAAGAGHYRNQGGVNNDFKDHKDRAHDQRIDHTATEEIHLAEAIESQCHNIDGKERIHKCVED
jgi:hypothetical protein